MNTKSVIYPDKSSNKVIYLGYTQMLDMIIEEFKNTKNFKHKIMYANSFIELAKVVSAIEF